MKGPVLLLALVAVAAACTVPESVPSAASEAHALKPWEPIDPGFIGCEGG